MSLVSLSTLKEYLPEITGTGADTELTNIIKRAEADIARFLGFPVSDAGGSPSLEAATYTLYIDNPVFNNKFVLRLPIKPLITITSIHSDPNRDYTASTEITSGEYHLDLQNAEVIIKIGVSTVAFSNAFRSNRVVCSAGYSSAPEDLIHAVCVFASQLHRQKTSQGSAGQVQHTHLK